MKREILFRGKRIYTGEWVEGYYVITPELKYRMYLQPFQVSQNTWFNVIPETVGQFTGLVDKNGKRIFEGDIVTLFDDDIGKTITESVIYYQEFCQFAIKNTHQRLNFLSVEDIEVAGNIFDNLELLEGGGK